MSYKLSNRSKSNLVGVHPDLVRVVERAIEITEHDFTVFEGTRTREKQVENYKRGVSRAIDGSRHLVGKDGYAHAVDLVPWIGYLTWDWDRIYPIANAVRDASKELGVPIKWGGAWDVLLNEQDADSRDIVQAYNARRRAMGRSSFTDGPHFELPLSPEYPQF